MAYDGKQTYQGRPILYVGRVRKDGKFKCEFVFPSSGRRISKLKTAEQIEQLREEYQVQGF